MTARANQAQFDMTFLVVTLILVAFGLIMVYSTSTIIAMKDYGDSYFFIKRQVIWAVLGFLMMLGMARVPYTELRRFAKLGLLVCVILLIAVLVLSIGKTAGGARRWFSLGPISFQPAEFLKVVVVVYLADALARKEAVMRSFMQGVVPQVIVLGLLAGLLLLQPDLGTAIIIVSVGSVLLYLGGARLGQMAGLALAALPAIFFLIFHVGYRKRRWDAFLDPWQDPLGRGFQVIQSFLALGSGGLSGRGLCESQQKLFYLPAPHTDFIFSIVGEELGFLGTFGLVLLFGFLVWRGFEIARHCPDRFGKLLAAGITLLLGIQVVINMSVTMGLVPTKGTTLPFISSGGSSLFFSLMAAGILLSISKHQMATEAG